MRSIAALAAVFTGWASVVCGSAPGQAGSPEEDKLFQAAELLYQVRECGLAVAVYDRFLAKSPGDSLWATAEYKKAECLRTLGRATEALAGYERVACNSGDHKLAASSQFALGELYRLLNTLFRHFSG